MCGRFSLNSTCPPTQSAAKTTLAGMQTWTSPGTAVPAKVSDSTADSMADALKQMREDHRKAMQEKPRADFTMTPVTKHLLACRLKAKVSMQSLLILHTELREIAMNQYLSLKHGVQYELAQAKGYEAKSMLQFGKQLKRRGS